MSVVVFLKNIKMPHEDYLNLIRNGQSSRLGLDNLNCLKKIIPDKTDVIFLKQIISFVIIILNE